MLNYKPHIVYISQVPKLNSYAVAFDILLYFEWVSLKLKNILETMYKSGL